MTKHHAEMTDEEYREWFAALERHEQLAHARKLRENVAADGDGDHGLAEMDDAIDLIELASHFEDGTVNVTAVPALDAIEMMWDWLCDICDDDFRKARAMSIEIETAKRWSRLLNALYIKAIEKAGSAKTCSHSCDDQTSDARR
jgi:hypothetical protein